MTNLPPTLRVAAETLAALHEVGRRFRRRDAGAACSNEVRVAEALLGRLEGLPRFPHAHIECPAEFTGLHFVIWGSEGQDLEELVPQLAAWYRADTEGMTEQSIAFFTFNARMAQWLTAVCCKVTRPVN